MDKLKVIFHIDDEAKWSMVLGNVKNLLEQVNYEDIEIEVLGNGNSVRKYDRTTQNDDLELMKDLSQKKVKFVACNNSLNGLKLLEEDLYDYITIVPAGVLELIEKQREGFTYIKP